jgi:putative sterol carrier protein
MTWKGILLKTENAVKAYTTGKLKIQGSYMSFLDFSRMF